MARKYRVSSRWVYKIRRQRDETGDIAPRRGKTGPKPKLAEHKERLLELVKEKPDATLEELQKRLDIAVSTVTIWRTLKALGFTSKKVVHAAEQDRPDVAERRTAWRFWRAHCNRTPEPL